MSPSRNGVARAAGAVVHRTRKKATQVLLIHRPRYGDWSLPKGHLDDGETYEEAAVREVEEETGLTGELGAHIGAIGYRTRTKQKVVNYWLLAADGGNFVPNKEADAARWLSLQEARQVATYRRDANVLTRAEQQLQRPKTAVVHLVRHAHAGERLSGDRADERRPLSPKGVHQASILRERLLRLPVASVRSSHYVRCEDTVSTLAEALALELQLEPLLVEGTAPEDVLGLLRKLWGTTAVLCSHGDVIANLVGHLAAEGVEMGDTLEWKKASVWTLDLHKGRVRAGSYAPPP